MSKKHILGAVLTLLVVFAIVAIARAAGGTVCGGDGFCTTSTAGTAMTCSDYSVGKGQFDDCALNLVGEKPQNGGFFSVTMGPGLASSGGAGGQLSASQPFDWDYKGDYSCLSAGSKTIYINWTQIPNPPGPEILNRAAVTVTCS